MIGGVLSAGLSNSTLLKNVIVVDQFGRDYSADLTKAVHNTGFDISSFLSLDQALGQVSAAGSVASGLQAVSSAVFSPQLGLVTMSGLVNSVTTPAVFSTDPTAHDITRAYMSNVAVSASPTESVSFDMGYKLRLSGRINEYDVNASPAYSGLFVSASALNSPYASLTNGGNYIGTTVSLADGLNLRTGFSWMNPDRQWSGPAGSDALAHYEMQNQSVFQTRAANAAVLGVSWNFARWGGLGVVASQTVENNGVLGGQSSGAMNFARSADTTAIDASMRIGLGKDWLATLSYGEGLTHLNVDPYGLMNSATGLHSRSYGLAIATRNLLGNDSLGFALTRPMYLDSGSGTMTAATAVDAGGNLTYSTSTLGFAEKTPETDLEVGYTKSFLDGRLALQSDAAYQLDVAGQSGRDAVTFITRLKLGL